MKKSMVSKESRYEENLILSKNELRDIFKKMDIKLLNNKFTIDGNPVAIPADKELRLKIKYEVDKNHAVSFRISWRNENMPVNEENGFDGKYED